MYKPRTNRELKRDFQEQTRFEDDYKVKIAIFQDCERADLFVSLYINGELEDEECVAYEDGEEPSEKMIKKAKYEHGYFGQYFENVELDKEIIYC